MNTKVRSPARRCQELPRQRRGAMGRTHTLTTGSTGCSYGLQNQVFPLDSLDTNGMAPRPSGAIGPEVAEPEVMSVPMRVKFSRKIVRNGVIVGKSDPSIIKYLY